MNQPTKLGIMIAGAYLFHRMFVRGQSAMSMDTTTQQQIQEASGQATSTQPTQQSGSGYQTEMFPMGRGSRSSLVAKLQAKLGFTGKDVDGIFGTMTETALQKRFGVTKIANSVDYERILQAVSIATVPVVPPTTQPPTGQKMTVGEMNKVFYALFKQTSIKGTYQYNIFIDEIAILAQLEKQTDAYLLVYAAYWKAYWKKLGYNFVGAARAERFLRSDIQKANADVFKSVRMKSLIARLQRLNIA